MLSSGFKHLLSSSYRQAQSWALTHMLCGMFPVSQPINPVGQASYPHSVDEDIEVQKICLRSHSQKWWAQDLNPGPSESQPHGVRSQDYGILFSKPPWVLKSTLQVEQTGTRAPVGITNSHWDWL